MVNSKSATQNPSLMSFTGLARDLAFVMPGFVISFLAFVVLLPLTILSFATAIVWVGALLLPTILLLASAFAELSRLRARAWGIDLPPVHYAPRQPGIMGLLRRVLEPRRWIDLAFETVVAFPLRLFTFVISAAWIVGALAGTTYFAWGFFLPRDQDTLAGLILTSLFENVPVFVSQSFLLDAGFNFVIGCILLVTLPLVARGLATLDAAATRAALGRTVSSRGWAWIAAVFFAVPSIAINWPLFATLYSIPVPIAMLLSLAFAGALLLAIRWPLVGIALQTVAVVFTALTAVGADAPWPWPVMVIILQAALVLLLSLRRTWPWFVIAWILPQAGAVVTAVLVGTEADFNGGANANIIVCASVSLFAGVMGIIVRQLISSRGALRAEQRTNAALSAQRRELDERTRIAQELHDVVAHSMSIISVQATTAPYRFPGLDAALEQEFETIAHSSRQALSEMRGLLTLLRSSDNDAEAPLAPQPTLNDIPALVEATRQSGTAITLQMMQQDTASVEALPVAAVTGLTAYRIVQEALANAVRHAPGAAIDVVMSTELQDTQVHVLSIDVLNGQALDHADQPESPGAGFGLSGVRERTIALGGSVDAGPTESGGFRLRVTLPLASS